MKTDKESLKRAVQLKSQLDTVEHTLEQIERIKAKGFQYLHLRGLPDWGFDIIPNENTQHVLFTLLTIEWVAKKEAILEELKSL